MFAIIIAKFFLIVRCLLLMACYSMFVEKTFSRSLVQTLWLPFLILIGIGSVVLLQVPQLQELKDKTKVASPEVLTRELEAEKLRLDLRSKMPAFGFDNLLADWVYLEFLEYFGDAEARQKTNYQLSLDYFDIIVDRDPRFRHIYLFLSTSGSLFAGMPERSIALIDKGLKSMTPQIPPDSFYVWRYKGIDELLFLGDIPAAIESFEKAADWATASPDENGPSAAQISQETAAFLRTNPNIKCAQVSVWTMVLGNAPEELTRDIAIARIQELGGNFVKTPEGGFTVKLPENCY